MSASTLISTTDSIASALQAINQLLLQELGVSISGVLMEGVPMLSGDVSAPPAIAAGEGRPSLAEGQARSVTRQAFAGKPEAVRLTVRAVAGCTCWRRVLTSVGRACSVCARS